MAFETKNEDVIRQDAPSATDDHSTDHDQKPVPKGAIVFALVMIAVYIGYFSLTWYEIVVLRGGAV